jgi:hypothetical protein
MPDLVWRAYRQNSGLQARRKSPSIQVHLITNRTGTPTAPSIPFSRTSKSICSCQESITDPIHTNLNTPMQQTNPQIKQIVRALYLNHSRYIETKRSNLDEWRGRGRGLLVLLGVRGWGRRGSGGWRRWGWHQRLVRIRLRSWGWGRWRRLRPGLDVKFSLKFYYKKNSYYIKISAYIWNIKCR